MTFGISWPPLTFCFYDIMAALKGETGGLGFCLVLLWKDATVLFFSPGENKWPFQGGVRVEREGRCGILTFQFTKGNTIPKVNKPSIGPPHMPWMLRAACREKQVRIMKLRATWEHLFIGASIKFSPSPDCVLINHVLSGNHISLLGSVINIV